MKVKALKNCGYNFSGYGKSVFFKQGEVYDLSDDQAKTLITLGYVASLNAAKMLSVEEKMLEPAEKENKLFEPKKKVKKSKKK